MNESKPSHSIVETSSDMTQVQRLPMYPGLDLLRLVAMIIVTLQHAIVAATSIEWTRFFGTSLGQYGVNIFCAISGFLAFQDHRTACDWLQRRLLKIYPAYWLAVLFGFAVNTLLKYKPVTFQLFILQLAGLGGFTRGNIVNIAVWFISLILLCYGLAYVARLSRYPVVMLVFFTGLFAYLTLRPTGIKLPHGHILSFCLAGLIGFCSPGVQRIIGAIICVTMAPLILFVPDTAYVAFTFGLMVIVLRMATVPGRVPGLARSTYEYFLIHGMCFAAVGHYLHGNYALIASGVLLAFAAACYGAIGLRSLAGRLEKRLTYAISLIEQLNYRQSKFW